MSAKGTGAAPDAAAPSTPDASAPAAPLPPGVENVGAYYKDSGGNWQPLPSEVVIFQSGGLVKHFASAGLMKEDLNGLVGGMRSRLVVSTPVTFILHVPQGRTANDYELVRLHVVGNNRQFQSVAGGLIHESSGSLRDEIDFSSTQIGPSAYQIVLGTELAMASSVFSSRRITASSQNSCPAPAKSSPSPSSTRPVLQSPPRRSPFPTGHEHLCLFSPLGSANKQSLAQIEVSVHHSGASLDVDFVVLNDKEKLYA